MTVKKVLNYPFTTRRQLSATTCPREKNVYGFSKIAAHLLYSLYRQTAFGEVVMRKVEERFRELGEALAKNQGVEQQKVLFDQLKQEAAKPPIDNAYRFFSEKDLTNNTLHRIYINQFLNWASQPGNKPVTAESINTIPEFSPQLKAALHEGFASASNPTLKK